MQFAPALTLPAQVFVWEKSPVAVIPEMANEELPVLLRLSVCAAPLIPDNWAGKVSEAVDKLTKGPSPVPFSAALCGLPEALSAKLSEALRLPGAAGVKVTLTVQVLFGVTVAPVQESALLVKSPAFVPAIVAVERVRFPVPLLVRVTLCAALVVATS